MKQPILKVSRLAKQYGSFRAVKGVSFSVKKGQVIGLLGPNGAGKTTITHMLLGITLPDAGRIAYFGREFFANRQSILQRINFTSAYSLLQGHITVRENLRVFAELYEVDQPAARAEKLIELFEMKPFADKKIWWLSSGQKMRANLAKSLINDPEIVLMDEPTASLDPDIADKTVGLIEELRAQRQLSLLYTSHNMTEVSRLCDEVIFLDHGEIVAKDTPVGLTKRFPETSLQLTLGKGRTILRKFLEKRGLAFQFAEPHRVVITTAEPQVPRLLFDLQKAGVAITDIDVKKPDLEDVFLDIARGGNHVR